MVEVLVITLSPKQFDLAFIIVTFNSENDIVRCINSINEHYLSNNRQIKFATIVVDNNSTDNTVSLIKTLKEKHSWLYAIENQKNIGFGSANNLGFKNLKANYYVLINADAWLLTDSVTPIIDTISQQKKIAICGIPLVYPNGSPQTYSYSFSSWHRWLLNILKLHKIVNQLTRVNFFKSVFMKMPYSRHYIKNQLKPNIDITTLESYQFRQDINNADWVCGAGMVISSNFIDQSGGFDERFFLYGEDEDLCISAYNNGFKVVTANVAPIAHKLGWKGKVFNLSVANFKYNSLSYFINKNIKGTLSKLLMKLILPFYVFGIRRFHLAFLKKANGKSQ